MFYLRTILAAFTLSALMPLAALAADSYSERYELDIHMSGFMGRLKDVLTSPEHLGKHKEVAGVAALLDKLGYFNVESVQCEYAVQDGAVAVRWAEHFEGLDPQSYFGQVFALPNKPLALAGYVPDDALMYIGMNNVPQQALLAINELGSAVEDMKTHEGLGEMFEDIDLAQVLQMLDAFGIEQQVNEVLTGELGMALFAAPNVQAISGGDFGPQHMDAAIFIGVKDSARVKQLLGMAAANAPLTPMGAMAGGWEGWYVNVPEAPSAAVMLGSDVLFVTPNLQNAMAHIDFSKQGQETDACQSYFDLNLSRLHDELVGPGLNMLMSEAPVGLEGAKSMSSYLFALPPAEQLGHVRAVTAYENAAGYESALTMNTALANYLFYYVGVGLTGLAESEAAK